METDKQLSKEDVLSLKKELDQLTLDYHGKWKKKWSPPVGVKIQSIITKFDLLSFDGGLHIYNYDYFISDVDKIITKHQDSKDTKPKN